MCVQEAARLIMEEGEGLQSAHLTMQGMNKNQAKQKGESK